MVDVAFLVLVAVTLAFMSVLVAYRMNVAGATTAQMVTVIAELWAVFAIWIAVLAITVGSEGYQGFARHFAEYSPAGRVAVIAAIVVSVVLFIHLQWTLRRAMQGGGGGRGA